MSPRPSKPLENVPGIPTLGRTLRLIRENLHMTRETAYIAHGVHPSTLFQIEAGKHRPKIETLDAIIRGYGVEPLLARHLYELRQPPLPLPPVDQLRRTVRDHQDWMSHLDDLEQRRTLAAYVDPLWNILACNRTWLSQLPGIEETYSVAKWIFSPIAREVLPDHDFEAAHSVAYNKAMLGIFPTSQQATDLINALRPNPTFRRMWAANLDVAYGRDADHPFHHRDRATGTLTSYRLSIAPVTESTPVYLVTSIAKPYIGPAYRPS